MVTQYTLFTHSACCFCFPVDFFEDPLFPKGFWRQGKYNYSTFEDTRIQEKFKSPEERTLYVQICIYKILLTVSCCIRLNLLKFCTTSKKIYLKRLTFCLHFKIPIRYCLLSSWLLCNRILESDRVLNCLSVFTVCE